VLVLTIDERGMAKSAQHKLEVAQRVYEIAVGEHGLRPEGAGFRYADLYPGDGRGGVLLTRLLRRWKASA